MRVAYRNKSFKSMLSELLINVSSLLFDYFLHYLKRKQKTHTFTGKSVVLSFEKNISVGNNFVLFQSGEISEHDL